MNLLSRWFRRLGRALSPSGPPRDPKVVFERYCDCCRSQGIEDLYLLLSFDCDTPADAPAALSLEQTLSRLGIKTTWAVPGEELRRGMDYYRRVADSGAHFINHGAMPHAQRRGDRYYSVTFYNEMDCDEVVNDIEQGHRIIKETLGLTPQGFRAPHFSYYQQDDQLAVIYGAALRLGYSFCSTTLPEVGLVNGPIFLTNGIYEVPLSGSSRQPRTILDSWSWLSDYHNLVLKAEYFDLFKETVDYFLSNHLPGVLNLYADPSHVIDAVPFHRAMDYLVANDVRSLDFPELIAITSGRR